jgi:alkylated DNA repair dioxygenase AlkB
MDRSGRQGKTHPFDYTRVRIPMPNQRFSIVSRAYTSYKSHVLDHRHRFFEGSLPLDLQPNADSFASLWSLHPDEYHKILMHGRLVRTPRWQQAYGANYHYTGNTNTALPVPPILEPFREWSQRTIDDGLNGMLLNWYDGQLGHYIGPHHDSTADMVRGAPIVTISLGEERIFRLSQPQSKETRDFVAHNGTVFIMPYDTNLAWKHAVPRFARYEGRRISITIRAFYGLRRGAGGSQP